MKKPLAPKTEALYNRLLTRAFGNAQAPFGSPKVADWPESGKTLLRAAVKHKYDSLGLNADPLLEKIPASWVSKRVVEIPSEEEALAYEEFAKRLPPGKRALALLPLAMGLRANEVITLPRRAVERAADHGELIVLRKGGREQRLPAKHARTLFKELLEVPAYQKPSLQSSPLKKKSPRAWKTVGEILSSGEYISQYNVLHRMIQKTGEEAGIEDLRPHKLRHAFATRMMRDGGTLPVIQWMLGHSSPATTARYVHPGALDAEKFVRQF
jgi:site-specific recombinase XerD